MNGLIFCRFCLDNVLINPLIFNRALRDNINVLGWWTSSSIISLILTILYETKYFTASLRVNVLQLRHNCLQVTNAVLPFYPGRVKHFLK